MFRSQEIIVAELVIKGNMSPVGYDLRLLVFLFVLKSVEQNGSVFLSRAAVQAFTVCWYFTRGGICY